MHVTHTPESQCVFKLSKFKSVKKKKHEVFFFPLNTFSTSSEVRRCVQLEEIHGGKVGVKSRQWRQKNALFVGDARSP